jgi:hypothetical protein
MKCLSRLSQNYEFHKMGKCEMEIIRIEEDGCSYDRIIFTYIKGHNKGRVPIRPIIFNPPPAPPMFESFCKYGNKTEKRYRLCKINKNEGLFSILTYIEGEQVYIGGEQTKDEQTKGEQTKGERRKQLRSLYLYDKDTLMDVVKDLDIPMFGNDISSYRREIFKYFTK